MTVPTQDLERELLGSHRFVAGMDEVGRGALAGPVSVGAVVVTAECGQAPVGLRDSKLLTPAAREALVEPVRAWARGWGVGHASPAEIDAHGIVGALCLAGHRALAQAGLPVELVLLDGVHDWLTPATLLEVPGPTPPVRTERKGDLRIASIAAASILAKTERDGLMARRHEDFPAYGWASNKGYAARAHIQALRELGPSAWHRRSWKLPV